MSPEAILRPLLALSGEAEVVTSVGGKLAYRAAATQSRVVQMKTAQDLTTIITIITKIPKK